MCIISSYIQYMPNLGVDCPSVCCMLDYDLFMNIMHANLTFILIVLQVDGYK